MKTILATVGALAAVTGVACAEEAAITVTGNVAMVSDYRARGVTVSDHSFALQGGFDVEAQSGFSAGVWASSLADGGDASLELDVYAGQAFALGETELAVGLIAYIYPDTDDLSYGEASVALSHGFGPIDGTIGYAYAWEQAAVADQANSYLYANVAAPVADVQGMPLTLGASLGYEDGPLAVEGEKVDWSLGLALEASGFEWAVSYVGSDLDDPSGDDGAVFALTRSY